MEFADKGVAESVSNVRKAVEKCALVAAADKVGAAIAGAVSDELTVELVSAADSAAVAAQVDMAAEEFAALNFVEVKTHLMV